MILNINLIFLIIAFIYTFAGFYSDVIAKPLHYKEFKYNLHPAYENEQNLGLPPLQELAMPFYAWDYSYG
ncbi:hypothetical protein Mgra_00003768 [Meloidogyne graminicola]|uniref:Uncharacterized protein n=1 Tax=Meloidogyne graminicola TaxID=189291 RepID=A0A8S9ZUM5_9BILA|nr:hypothetical protein Mgra_00003768 [Meloidogyne graminicola]